MKRRKRRAPGHLHSGAVSRCAHWRVRRASRCQIRICGCGNRCARCCGDGGVWRVGVSDAGDRGPGAGGERGGAFAGHSECRCGGYCLRQRYCPGGGAPVLPLLRRARCVPPAAERGCAEGQPQPCSQVVCWGVCSARLVGGEGGESFHTIGRLHVAAAGLRHSRGPGRASARRSSARRPDARELFHTVDRSQVAAAGTADVGGSGCGSQRVTRGPGSPRSTRVARSLG